MIHGLFAAEWWPPILTLMGVVLFLIGERRRNDALRLASGTAQAPETALPAERVINETEPAKPKRLSLPRAEKERIADSLVATLDYLEGGFEEYIAPIREARSWPGLLRWHGPEAVKEAAELAMIRVRDMPGTFGEALKGQIPDLELVKIHPLAIKSKAIPMEQYLHSLAAVAAIMPHEARNETPLGLAGNEFAKAFTPFDDELRSVKDQIREMRRMIMQGELD